MAHWLESKLYNLHVESASPELGLGTACIWYTQVNQSWSFDVCSKYLLGSYIQMMEANETNTLLSLQE